MPRQPGQPIEVTRVGNHVTRVADTAVVEAPLEIRLAWTIGALQHKQTVAVTMRTPGDDQDLAIGLLVAEGLIRRAEDIVELGHCGDDIITLYMTKAPPADRLQDRIFIANSACGLCSKTSADLLPPMPFQVGSLPTKLPQSLFTSLAECFNQRQSLFATTGGCHGVGLFDVQGHLLGTWEDVGRHNALDKMLGANFRSQRWPLQDHIVLLSGRVGFELIQKSLMAGIPVIAAYGAPTSLAVELAELHGQTLIGFLSADRFNIYSHPQRIDL